MKNKILSIFKITLASFPIVYTLCFLGINLYDSYTHKIDGVEGFFFPIYYLGLVSGTAFFFWLFVLGCFTIAYFFKKIYKRTDAKKEKLPYIFEGLFWILTTLHISVFLGWIK